MWENKRKMAETVASGVFNAFAFAGASFLMSKLNNSGYTAEMNRHNLAMEKYTKERDQWNEARLQEIDRVTKLHTDQKVAEQDREETLNDFAIYARKVEQEKKIHDVEGVERIFHQNRPRLNYKPSNEMQNYMTFMKYIAAGVVSGGIMLII